MLNFTPAQPATNVPADGVLAAVVNGWENEWYIDPIYRGAYPQATVEALKIALDYSERWRWLALLVEPAPRTP